MSHSLGAVRFVDGKILYWYYSYSADHALNLLFETVEDADSSLSDYLTCACDKDEPVEFFLDGTYWQGRACQHCMHIKDARLDDDPGLLDRCQPGTTDWLVWDANIIPSEGGEKEATLAYWNSLVALIGTKLHQRLKPDIVRGLRKLGISDAFFEGGLLSINQGMQAFGSAAARLEVVSKSLEHLPSLNITPDALSLGQRLAAHCRSMARLYAECVLAAKEILARDRTWLRNTVVRPALMFLRLCIVPLQLIPRLHIRLRFLQFGLRCMAATFRDESHILKPLHNRMIALEQAGDALYEESRHLRPRLAKQHGAVFPDLEFH